MTKIRALINAFFYLGLVCLGIFIALAVTWKNDNTKWFGVIAFFLVGFGALFSCIPITRLLTPSKVDFDFSTLSDRVNYIDFKRKVGKKVHFINATYITIFFIIFAVAAYSYFELADRHEYDQLKNHGQTEKVLITKIDYVGKGSAYAFFDFYYNGKKYSDRLSDKGLQQGDSSTIIFSTKNPDIVKWLEDFDPNEY